jgi:hypothetical protein
MDFAAEKAIRMRAVPLVLVGGATLPILAAYQAIAVGRNANKNSVRRRR